MRDIFCNSSPGALTLEQARALEIKRQRERRRQAEELAAQGRGEDPEIAHVARGELVVPDALQSPEVLAAVRRAAKAEGIPFEQLRVGSKGNSINPNTGVAEFGAMRDNLFGSPQLSQPPRYGMTAPLPPSPKIIDDPNMMPTVMTQMYASLPIDAGAHRSALAKEIFPGEKYGNVADRFGEQNGRTYYRDNDGASYYAQPALKAPTSLENVAADAKYAASKFGPAIPAVSASVGGFVGGTFGPVGAGVGGALGYRSGAAGRQSLAQRYAGDPSTAVDHLDEIGEGMLQEGLKKGYGRYIKGLLR